MQSISFTIDGNPKSLSRPVICRATKGGTCSKPWLRDPCKEAKQCFREAVETKMNPSDARIFFDDSIPLTLDIEFFIRTPKNFFINNNREQGRIKPDARSKWPTKPDLDNLDKFVLDALQGLLFKNDAQIVKQTIVKAYDLQPPFMGRTVIFMQRANVEII
jgi:Holliday junction resolvase RusA-like endonuclease